MMDAHKRSRRARGFTLVETMLATAFLSLLLAIIAWLGLDVARISSRVSTSATLQGQTRFKMDTFINDVRDSDDVLNSYTASNGVAYTSNIASTLILEAPAYKSDGTIPTTTDAGGNVVPAAHDIIVYHLVALAHNDSNGPYTLNRLVDADPNSVRSDIADTVLAKNVQSAAFTCLIDQPMTGDGVQTDLSLKSDFDPA